MPPISTSPTASSLQNNNPFVDKPPQSEMLKNMNDQVKSTANRRDTLAIESTTIMASNSISTSPYTLSPQDNDSFIDESPLSYATPNQLEGQVNNTDDEVNKMEGQVNNTDDRGDTFENRSRCLPSHNLPRANHVSFNTYGGIQFVNYTHTSYKTLNLSHVLIVLIFALTMVFITRVWTLPPCH